MSSTKKICLRKALMSDLFVLIVGQAAWRWKNFLEKQENFDGLMEKNRWLFVETKRSHWKYFFLFFSEEKQSEKGETVEICLIYAHNRTIYEKQCMLNNEIMWKIAENSKNFTLIIRIQMEIGVLYKFENMKKLLEEKS